MKIKGRSFYISPLVIKKQIPASDKRSTCLRFSRANAGDAFFFFCCCIRVQLVRQYKQAYAIKSRRYSFLRYYVAYAVRCAKRIEKLYCITRVRGLRATSGQLWLDIDSRSSLTESGFPMKLNTLTRIVLSLYFICFLRGFSLPR